MKSKTKYFSLFAMITVLALTLTGCANNGQSIYQAPTSGPYAWVFSLFGKPIQNIMLAVENQIGGSNGAGWAIIIITFVVQLIVMPLRLASQRKMTTQQEKTQKLQPQMKLIQEALKKPGLTQPQQMQISQLQMRVYKENNMSMMGGMGCLPLLIQLPIMMGIYQAVAYSKELGASSFFGISLGQRSIILTVIATLLYVVQGYLSMVGIPEEQKKAMQMTLILSPAMTFFISISAPGALALYFLVGGLIAILQQLITTFIIMPKVKRDVAAELNERPLKVVVTQDTIDNILNTTSSSTSTPETNKDLHQDLRARNAGKQKRPNDSDKN